LVVLECELDGIYVDLAEKLCFSKLLLELANSVLALLSSSNQRYASKEVLFYLPSWPNW